MIAGKKDEYDFRKSQKKVAVYATTFFRKLCL